MQESSSKMETSECVKLYPSINSYAKDQTNFCDNDAEVQKKSHTNQN